MNHSIRLSCSGALAEIKPDKLTENGVVLLIDGVEQSHVDVTEPGFLLHDYVIRFSTILDSCTPRLFPDGPAQVLHLGAGALTFPRWVEHRWPASEQTVVDIEPELTEFILKHLPMKSAPENIISDAATVLHDHLPGRIFDVITVDLFNSADAPGTLTSYEFFSELVAALGPQGMLLLNFGDEPPMDFASQLSATLMTVCGSPDHALLSAPATVLAAQEEGNLVFAHSRAGFSPAERERIWALGPHTHEVLNGSQLTQFLFGVQTR